MLWLNVSWEKIKIYIIRFLNFIKLGDYNVEYLLFNCEDFDFKGIVVSIYMIIWSWFYNWIIVFIWLVYKKYGVIIIIMMFLIII